MGWGWDTRTDAAERPRRRVRLQRLGVGLVKLTGGGYKLKETQATMALGTDLVEGVRWWDNVADEDMFSKPMRVVAGNPK